jgi:acyl transferase domain-containing protein
MLGVSLSEKEIKPWLNEELSLAAVNSPTHCVVSGPHQAIDSLSSQLNKKGHKSRRLHTSHAFHSSMMAPILDEFSEIVREIPLKTPEIPYISNLTGKWLGVEEPSDPRYWANHLRGTVRFHDGLKQLLKKEDAIFIEIGAGNTLYTLARHHENRRPRQVFINLVRHPGESAADDRYLLKKIGQLWLYGTRVNWQAIHEGEIRYRLPLPTYSFEGKRYWIEADPGQLVPGKEHRSALSHKRQDIDDWFYIPTWTNSFLPPVNGPLLPEQFTWLLYTDEVGLGDLLGKHLEKEGQQVVRVGKGPGFKKVSDAQYIIAPGNPHDYSLLFNKLRQQGTIPRRIVHLWSVTAKEEAVHDDVHKCLDLGFYSLLYTAQAIGTEGIGKPLQLAVVTSHMQSITGEEPGSPGKAAVLGPVKVIPREYPHITCKCIDITLPKNGSRQDDRLARRLLLELARQSRASVVALRHNSRWEQDFKRVPLDKVGNRNPLLRKNGVYLITGGLGGIGLELARHLAGNVSARLVLVSRSPFPGKQEWDQWLETHGDRDPVSMKIRKIQEVEQLANEVLVLSVDVTNPEQVRETIRLVLDKFQHIHGVIHAAGAADYAGIIQLRTKQETDDIMAAKIKGTLILEDSLTGIPLDFFVLCSSLSSVLGAGAQVGYCGANAFLDAFAFYRSSITGDLTISINWDGWQQVGMAVEAVKRMIGSKDVPHPLFHRCITHKKKGLQIYISNFNENNYWVLKEHRIIGKATLPGTGCLEVARAAFEDHTGSRTMEMRNVVFTNPLMLEQGEQRECWTMLQKKEAHYEFVIASYTTSGQQSWIQHAKGEIAPLETPPAETPKRKYDIPRLEANCNLREIHPDREQLQTDLMVFGPRWHNFKKARIGHRQGVGTFELHKEFAADTGFYKLHPALLDTAVAFLGGQFKGYYLPLSYKRLRIYAPLPPRIISYNRYIHYSGSSKDTLRFNITIMDETGVPLVDIDEYTVILIKEETRARAEKRLFGPDSDKKAMELVDLNPLELNPLKDAILPTEGLEAFNRILGMGLPQVLTSTMDLETRLKETRVTKIDGPGQPTGKVSNRPLHPRPRLSTAYVEPGTELEKRIAKILQTLLGYDRVGIHDDFFELGGDSLKLMSMASEIHQNLEVEISLPELFNSPNIKALAQYIARAETSSYLSIQATEKKEYYPLSSAQKRLYTLQHLEKNNVTYNETIVIALEGELEPGTLNLSFEKLVRRHESLRTSIQNLNHAAVQKIHLFNEIQFSTQYHEANQEEAQQWLKNFKRPFDLTKPPLMRVGVVKTGKNRCLVIMDTHHIITDGFSMAIFMKELIALYAGEELPGLAIHYKDYTQWQGQEKQKAALQRQKEYWLKEFAGKIPVLNLPIDYDRPMLQSFAGQSLDFSLSQQDTEALKTLALQEDITLFMLLLALYNILLAKLSSQEDIVVGTDIAGRNHPDLKNVTGMLINNLALRNQPRGRMTVKEFFKEIKKRAIAAFDNQDYQFDDLVGELRLKRDMSRNPLFDVMFAFQNFQLEPGEMPTETQKLSGLKMLPYDYKNNTAKFDLNLTGAESGGQLLFTLEYCTNLFKKETVRKFIQYFKNILSAVIHDPGEKISGIPMMGEEEKKQLFQKIKKKKGILNLEPVEIEKNPDEAEEADFDF